MTFWSSRGIDTTELRHKFVVLGGEEQFDFGGQIVDFDQTLKVEQFLNVLETAGLPTQILNGSGKLSFEAMSSLLETESNVQRKCEWINKYLARYIAEALPVADGEDITSKILYTGTESLAHAFPDFVQTLKTAAEKAQDALSAGEKRAASQNDPGGSSEKMTVMKLEPIAQFFMGVEGVVQGPPHPDVDEGIRLEHTQAADSSDEFETSNYQLTTCPSTEYLVVVDSDERNRVNALSASIETHRHVLSPKACMDLEKVKAAGLALIEVIALILYTGPMFAKYNAVLRGFPEAAVQGLRGNAYATTVHVLVSGLRKLSRASPVPRNGLVFRGVGGLEAPAELMRSDALGVRGGVERGVLSTTLSRAVALFYSKRPDSDRRILLEILVGAVDRPASMSLLSQYSREEELTFGPLSFLEFVSQRLETAPDGGAVLVLRVRISANLSGMTLEERVAQRSKVVSSLAVWVGHNLEQAAAAFAGEMADAAGVARSELHTVAFSSDAGLANLVWYARHQLLADFRALAQRMAAQPVEDFNDNDVFNAAVGKVLEMDRFTRESMVFARMHPARLAKYDLPNWRVRFNHSELRDELQLQAAQGGEAAQHAALRLAHMLGLVQGMGPGALEECNEVDKTPLFEAAEARDHRALQLLLQAKANVHARDEHGSTALMVCRDAPSVAALVAAGADVNATRPGFGYTGLHYCAVPGRAEALAALLAAGADARVRCKDGKTALDFAREFKQEECVRILEAHARDAGAGSESSDAAAGSSSSPGARAASRACTVA